MDQALPEEGNIMSDFSFVKDQAGTVRGLWVRRPEDAQDQIYLMTLFLRGGVSSGEISAGFRVVTNRVDGNGGCFVMLGPVRAPGE